MIEFTDTSGTKIAVRDGDAVVCVGTGSGKVMDGDKVYDPGTYRFIAFPHMQALVLEEYDEILRRLGWAQFDEADHHDPEKE